MKVLSEKKNSNKNQKDIKKDKSINKTSDNQMNKNNIMNYFVFNEDENNIISNPKNNKNVNKIDNINKINKKEEENKEQKIKVDYNVNSFITSNYRPDLYSPFGIISGNKYRLRMAPEKNSQKIEEVDDECEENEEKKKEEEKENDKDDSSSTFSLNEKDNNEELLLKNIKSNRYYNIEPDISVKCHICDQIGHRKDICPNYNIKFCYRCLSSKHEDRDCDKIKCFRCNRLGHKTFNCQLKDNQLIICDSCHCIGHKKKECLIKPMEISKKFIKNNNLSCIDCGSNTHVLCPLDNRELPEILEDEDYSWDLTISESEDDDRSSLTPKAEEENESKEKKKKRKTKKFLRI